MWMSRLTQASLTISTSLAEDREMRLTDPRLIAFAAACDIMTLAVVVAILIKVI